MGEIREREKKTETLQSNNEGKEGYTIPTKGKERTTKSKQEIQALFGCRRI